ncbi:MAG: type II 3-dehydroquinate dehydratase [Bacteroidetes bacterium]|nr:MAG: type II 3-dehydroquinate dehydratase [Bacteroidota bacterium]
MNIAIINGPNLNLLGKRETNIYGQQSFDDYLQVLRQRFPQHQLAYYQSNVEGDLIGAIQQFGFSSQGIVLNPGGYTHTSVALGDAIAAVTAPVIEVHISNTAAREAFRQISHVSAKCRGTIIGLGLQGYELAVRALLGE